MGRQSYDEFSSLRERLLRSHLLVAQIGLALVIVAVGAALYSRATTLRLANEREPAVQATTRALAGIERSFAGLRAWVVSRRPEFARDRARAWKHDVEPALRELQALSGGWDEADQRRFAEAMALIEETRAAQQRVEEQAADFATMQSTADAAWHVARELHVRESEPTARRAAALLAEMAARQRAALRDEADRLVRAIDGGMALLLAFVVAAGVVALLVSRRAAERITRPLATLAAATSALADRGGTADGPSGGARATDVMVVDDDEIGRLTHTFNRMRASVLAAEHALTDRAAEATRAQCALQAEVLERAQAEAMFRQLLEATPDAILIVDERGTVVLVNAAAERLFGFTRAELIGGVINPLLPAALEWARVLADPSPLRVPPVREPELVAVQRGGATVPVEIRANPLVLEERTLLAIAVRDVTDRQRAAQALRDLNAQLERRVLERTVELRRSNEELDRFAAIASHDLQEPLRMVASYTELLFTRYRGRLDAEGDEFLTFALEGARRMQRLIRDLLAYARVSTRAGALELSDAGLILERTLANLRLAIQESGAKVTSDPMPWIRADASQIGQLLQNLMANALKFRGTRRLEVHIGVEEMSDAWLFSVRDNGVGIAPEHRDRIFALFERLQRDPSHPGSGIGLALCKKIVERHGGGIWVEAAPQGGSVFCFTLPRRAEDECPPARAAAGGRA